MMIIDVTHYSIEFLKLLIVNYINLYDIRYDI